MNPDKKKQFILVADVAPHAVNTNTWESKIKYPNYKPDCIGEYIFALQCCFQSEHPKMMYKGMCVYIVRYTYEVHLMNILIYY